jgi:hypothetical protein
MNCFFCPGVAHPATGCQYSASVVACRDCVVKFWAWFREQQNKRGRPGRDKRRPHRVHADFYQAAGKKI